MLPHEPGGGERSSARICPKCETPHEGEGDFCVADGCTEYLVWLSPTVQAAGAEARGAGAEAQTPPGAAQTGAAVDSAETQTHAAASPAETQTGDPDGHGPRVAIALRDDIANGSEDALAVEPGSTLELRGRVRNQSRIVDSYALAVERLPAQWWTIEPPVLHLLPFASGESPAGEFRVLLAPPRSPAATARDWDIAISATSAAGSSQTAEVARTLRLAPFDDVGISLEHDRATARWRGRFVAKVVNDSNHDVVAALSAGDEEGHCSVHFRAPGKPSGRIEALERALQTRWAALRHAIQALLVDRDGKQKEDTSLALRPLRLPPGAGKRVEVCVYPRRLKLTGTPASHELTLRATPPPAGEDSPPAGGGSQPVGEDSRPASEGSQPAGESPQPAAEEPDLAAGEEPELARHTMTYRQRAWLPWWTSLLPVALLALVAFFIVKYLERPKVPDVIGHPVAHALEKLEAVDLKGEVKPAVQSRSVSDCEADHSPKPVETGSVFAESPCVGARIPAHHTVELFTVAARGPARVPDLKDLTLTAAEKTLADAGLAVGDVKPYASAPTSWVVIAQKPSAGEKRTVKGPADVEVKLGQVAAVPNLIGRSPAAASQALRSANLVLGTVRARSPEHPRSSEVIVTQEEAASTVVPVGSTIGVRLGEPAKPHPHASAKQSVKAKSKKSGAKPHPASKPAVAALPALGAVSGAAAATALAKAGMHTRETRAISASAPAGRLLRSEPPAGTKLRRGSTVKLVLSAGFPEVAVDDGHSVLALDGVTGKPIATLAGGPQPASEPSWSPSGRSVAYVSAGRIMLVGAHGAGGPVALTPAGESFALPTFPATPSAPAVLATVARPAGGAEKLCLVAVARSSPSCIPEPGWTLGSSISWAPDGRELLVGASRTTPAPGVVGLLELTSRTPFATRAADWGTGRLVTPTAPNADTGVLAGAFAPVGGEVALVEDFAGAPTVTLAAASDLALTKARRLSALQPACAVQWRPDGAELLVLMPAPQSAPGAVCGQGLGTLYRVDPAQPDMLSLLARGVEHPSWQPLPGVG